MIYNLTKRKMISRDHVDGDKLGFMFKDKFLLPMIFRYDKDHRELWHMFFVKFTIDIIYLDKDHKIIELCQRLRPWKIYLPKHYYRYVIELQEGFIDHHDLKLGQVIAF